MSLHSGIDVVAYVSRGIYTETYGSGGTDNIADLFCSWGLLENAPVGEETNQLILSNVLQNVLGDILHELFVKGV